MSVSDMETPGVLDLTGADTSTFDAIPAARYKATVWEVKWDATKGGENAKLPAGSPLLKVQFKLSDEYQDVEYVNDDGQKTKIGKNRRVFGQWSIPPADYDPEKAAKLKGMLVNMLLGLGYEEKAVTKGNFKLDLEDMTGRECVVVVGKQEYPKGSGSWNNPVNGVKPAGSVATGSSNDSSGLL